MPIDALGTPAVPSVPNGHPNEDDLLLNAEEGIEVDEVDEDADEQDKKEDEEETDDSEGEEEEPPKIAFERPTIKELKAEFPDIFKKFPALRDSYFREIEFTQIFPTVDDAKEAVQESESFSAMSDSALEGDPTPIIESLEKTDKAAFKLFSVSFLPALYKKSPETYSDVVTPVVEGLFRQFYGSSNAAVKEAALLLSKEMYGDHGEAIAKGEKTFSRFKQVSDEQKALRETREANNTQAFRTAYSEIATKIDKGLAAIILKDIDPNNAFSPFVRKGLAEEAAKRIKKQLDSDNAHKTVMAGRWKRAKSNGYSDDDKGKIISTFLARAKSLVPKASETVRSLAQGKQGEAAPGRPQARREINGGRPPRTSSRVPEKADLRKMSDLDILNME